MGMGRSSVAEGRVGWSQRRNSNNVPISADLRPERQLSSEIGPGGSHNTRFRARGYITRSGIGSRGPEKASSRGNRAEICLTRPRRGQLCPRAPTRVPTHTDTRPRVPTHAHTRQPGGHARPRVPTRTHPRPKKPTRAPTHGPTSPATRPAPVPLLPPIHAPLPGPPRTSVLCTARQAWR